jgi:hypothetical protein
VKLFFAPVLRNKACARTSVPVTQIARNFISRRGAEAQTAFAERNLCASAPLRETLFCARFTQQSLRAHIGAGDSNRTEFYFTQRRKGTKFYPLRLRVNHYFL